MDGNCALREAPFLLAFSEVLGGFDLGDLGEKPLPCRPQIATGLFSRWS
jgi:hypothetical protein